MTEFAQSLQVAVLDRPVVNQTGIEGRLRLHARLDA
jgi:hypothetical protein